MTTTVLTLSPGVEIASRVDAAGRWLGIDAIRVAGVELLAPGQRWRPEFRTPEGVELCNFVPVATERRGEVTVLVLRAHARITRLAEWQLHAPRALLNLGDLEAEPQALPGTVIELELRPAERNLAGTRATGFAYRWRFRSDTLAIYRMLERIPFAPGGTVHGSQVFQRTPFADSLPVLGGSESTWSTEWYLPDCENQTIFQFNPFQTELQGFTFLTCTSGTLITWSNEVSHIRTLIEKQRNLDAVLHWHEHCGDLTDDFSSAWFEVLWAPGSLAIEARHDLHERTRELVYDVLHAAAGLRQERVTSYGVITEWSNPDIERYINVALPRLASSGVKTMFVQNLLHHNQNQWGMGNMCAGIDLCPSPLIGPERFKEFFATANKLGINVEMWMGTYVSTLARLAWDTASEYGQFNITLPPKTPGTLGHAIATAKQPWVRTSGGHHDHDHYPNINCLNLRDPTIHAFISAAWKKLHDEYGVGGIFNDSSNSMTHDKFHYIQNPSGALAGATPDQAHFLGRKRGAREPRAQVLSQFPAAMQLWKNLQQAGLSLNTEDLGVFGTHRHPGGGGTAGRLNSMPLWSDCVGEFDPEVAQAAGMDPHLMYFSGFANRMVWFTYWDIVTDRLTTRECFDAAKTGIRGDHDLITGFHLGVIKAFNAAEPFMYNRRMLPANQGVMYRQGSVRILWATAAATHDLGGNCRVTDLMTGAITSTAGFAAERLHTYRIEG